MQLTWRDESQGGFPNFAAAKSAWAASGRRLGSVSQRLRATVRSGIAARCGPPGSVSGPSSRAPKQSFWQESGVLAASFALLPNLSRLHVLGLDASHGPAQALFIGRTLKPSYCWCFKFGLHPRPGPGPGHKPRTRV